MGEEESQKQQPMPLLSIDEKFAVYSILYLGVLVILLVAMYYIIEQREKKFYENSLCINRMYSDTFEVCIFDNYTRRVDCANKSIYARVKNASRVI